MGEEHRVGAAEPVEPLDRAYRDHRPGVSAKLTITAFDRSSLRWLEIGS
jgi:hypothetical protein